jgi:hypothetical protein
VARIDFTGLTIINLDPAIAAIIGRNSAVVTFHRIGYIPVFAAQATRRFERSSVTASINDYYSPGNGVYLTSRATSAELNYSYLGLRRITLGASFGYNRLSSLGQSLSVYSGYQAGVGCTYKLSGYAHFEFRYDYRRYNTGSAGYRNDSSRLSAGFAFSPASRPLAIW